jgi:Flp pilus assembly protein TadG
MMFRNIDALIREEAGSELIEFAICAPLLFAFIFGIIFFSMAVYANQFVANAAKDAARFAAVRGSTWNGAICSATSSYDCTATSSDVTNFVVGALPPGLSSANLSVSTSWPGKTTTGDACDTLNGANSPQCIVTIQVSYLFTFPLPFVKGGAIPMLANSSMTIEQ